MNPIIESIPNKYFSAKNLDGSEKTCTAVGNAMLNWLKSNKRYSRPPKQKSRRKQLKEVIRLIESGYSVGRWLHYSSADLYREFEDGTIGTPLHLRLLRDLINKGIIREAERKQVHEFIWIQYLPVVSKVVSKDA